VDFPISKGLRDAVYLQYFKIYIILHLWKRKCHGIRIWLKEQCLYTPVCGRLNGTSLANDRKDIEYIYTQYIKKLLEEYEKLGLIVNIQKTIYAYLCIGTEAENLIMESNKEVITCKQYKYLGIILNRKDKWSRNKQANNRITKARRKIACLNGILWNKSIMKNSKFNIYEIMVKSVMLYNCENTEINRKK